MSPFSFLKSKPIKYTASPLIPPISTKKIDEKFTPNNENASIHKSVQENTVKLNGDFFIFLKNFIPADNIKNIIGFMAKNVKS